MLQGDEYDHIIRHPWAEVHNLSSVSVRAMIPKGSDSRRHDRRTKVVL